MSENKHRILQPPAKIGIVGGGQLGKMITAEAKRMGYHVTVLDPTPQSPAAQVADKQIIASFMDRSAIKKLAADCDVVTYEFEHINSDMLIELETEGYNIYPSGNSLKNVQDKYIQKEMLKNAGIPVPDYVIVENTHDMMRCIDTLGLPFILKTRKGGYDGKGNFVVKTKEQIGQVLEEFKGYDLMAEKFINFEQELSIIVARDLNNNYTTYPIVENLHENSILHLTKAPANISDEIKKKVTKVAQMVMEVLDDYGVFCIEMFLTPNGEVYVNEIAPRPHNSGHYTIEACITSQFEQLVRVITGMPLGSPQLISPCAMVNILGNDTVQGSYSVEGLEEVLGDEGVFPHLYGKHSTKNMKKIGHITVLNESVRVAEEKALRALEKIKLKPL